MNTATPIEIPGSGRTLQGFLAEPEAHSGPRAAVIVIHEIFGPDAHIQDVARRLAREGYVAVAPTRVWTSLHIPDDGSVVSTKR
jgi:carboxymethylenebutenolidase